MLKHGRAGVPMEVMGLMLGEFVDEYTVQVIDVFAMPQSGTTVSVESVDHVFQQRMVDMLKQTGRYVAPVFVLPRLLVLTFWKVRNGSRLVSLPPWLWLLALQCRHQHTTGIVAVRMPTSGVFQELNKLRVVIRATGPPLSCRRSRPHSVREGQGRDRRFPADQPRHGPPRARAAPDDVEHWAHQQALDPSTHSRT